MTLQSSVRTPPRRARTLWLVRHATPLVEPGICYGALDVAADQNATLSTAARLVTALPRHVTMRSSTLQRCEQLAQSVQGLRAALPIKRDDRLREMNFGAWEGQPWDAIDPAAVQAWTDDFAHCAPGGGETVAAFMRRVAAAFDETCAALAPGRDTVWITHAGVIRATILIASGVRCVASAAQWPRGLSPDFGAWHALALPD